MRLDEPLVDVIMDSKCPYKDSKQVLQDLKRAIENRVGLLFLLSCKEVCRKIWSQELEDPLNRMLSEYHSWMTSVRNLLTKLSGTGARFLVIKNAPYPHISFDVDFVFPSVEDFENVRPILVSSPVRADPHVAGLREYKALTVVISAEKLWKERRRTTIYGAEVWTASPEHSLLIHALHAFKHREVYLGDLLSMKEIIRQLDRERAVDKAREIGGTLILAYLDNILSTILGECVGVTLPFPLRNIVQIYTERSLAAGYLPLKIPRGMVVLAGLRLKVPLRIRDPV